MFLTDASAAANPITVQVGVNNDPNGDRIDISLADLASTTVFAVAIDLSTQGGAQTALGTLDTALDTLNSNRATLGATQNRLESAMRDLETNMDHVNAAQSRIRDADFAYETSQMSKFQIIQQAGVAALGQANQINQSALRLIQ